MPNNRILTKDEKIKKEISRLLKVFKNLDKNKLATVRPLIQNAAFMIISLDELQEIINRDGYTHEYQNGANQKGTKQTVEVKIHIEMTRNLHTIIKQLADLAPEAVINDDRLAAFRRIQ